MNLIIMTARNGLSYSKACLPTLRAQTVPVTILLADNASTDGTTAWAKSQQDRDGLLFRLSNEHPISVATLWNRSLEWAWASGYQEALVVNQDTELLPETLETLSRFVGPGMVTCVSRRSREELAYDPDDLTTRENPDFSCYLLRKSAWDKVGRFDEGFEGAYFEDNDYHVRMHRAGVKAVCVSMPFLHHGSGTLKQATAEERRRIEGNAAKNRQRFGVKYGVFPGTKGYERLFV